MSSQVKNNRPFPGKPEAVIPFAPSTKNESSVSADQLDVAGQNVLALLHQAADISNEDYNHAVDVAHKLSNQLEDAKERIKDLEANLIHYQYRTDRAEKWLVQIAAEIEQRFFGKADDPPAPPAGPRRP
jgi:septal ring factor EnvC (AmiA/AmiB activator)